MKIFVGNLALDLTDQELEDTFAKFGKVSSVKIVRDMFTQESKGMGFVEMMNNVEATSAINELNVTELKGKMISVNKARPDRNNRKGGRR